MEPVVSAKTNYVPYVQDGWSIFIKGVAVKKIDKTSWTYSTLYIDYWKWRQQINCFTHGFLFDGCLLHYLHIRSKSIISICWMHLVKSKESLSPISFLEKTYFTSYVRSMFWATILYRHPGNNFKLPRKHG